jgi:hypothetical protein
MVSVAEATALLLNPEAEAMALMVVFGYCIIGKEPPVVC